MSEEEKISSAVAFTIITELRDQLKIKDMRIQKLEQKSEKYTDLLKECRELFRLEQGYFIKCLHEEALSNIITKINEVLHDE